MHALIPWAVLALAPPPTPAPSPGVGMTTSAATAPPGLVPRGEPARMAEAEVDAGQARWKPGTGLSVETKDRRFSLVFQSMVQLQMNVHHTPGVPAMGDTSATAAKNDLSLVFRRARVWFSGNLFTPHIKYRITLTFSPVELGYKNGAITRSPILDWFFTFDRVRDATVVVGQYKVPYNHQRMAKIAELQFVDRSGASNEFTMDRDIGFDVRSKDLAGLGKLRYYAGVYLGDGIALYGPSDFGLAYLARVEVLPFGQYDDLAESDLDRTLRRPRMLLGAAYSYIDRDPHDTHGFAGVIPLDGGKTTTHNATADLSFKYGGFAFEGGFFFRQGKRIPGMNVDDDGHADPGSSPAQRPRVLPAGRRPAAADPRRAGGPLGSDQGPRRREPDQPPQPERARRPHQLLLRPPRPQAAAGLLPLLEQRDPLRHRSGPPAARRDVLRRRAGRALRADAIPVS
jgi:phosphate-selective porin OprO/OprP